MVRNIFSLVLIGLLLSINSLPLSAQGQKSKYWPKQITLEKYQITIYQPEIERFSSNDLEARSAFHVYDGTNLPTFGAMWFKAQVHIDRRNNTVFYDDIEVMNVNFPDATPADIKDFTALIKAVAPTWSFNASLANLTSVVAYAREDHETADQLNNKAPNVFYEKKPTTLIYIEGEPILQPVDQSELYEYVVNTPYFIIYSKSEDFYYVQAGNYWYRARTVYDQWLEISSPPNAIQRLSTKSSDFDAPTTTEKPSSLATKPQLFVVTEQSVLIETQGEADIAPITDTRLFYITNSNNDLFKFGVTNDYYVRFSGRWYKSPTLYRGDWQFVAPDNLPVDFRKIPTNSPMSHVRISVPGTNESMSAALDNAIPQTAVVIRKTARMQPEFDGQPIYAAIKGTSLSYVINSNTSILKASETEYFAVDEGIWFKANDPQGNWAVATDIPDDVLRIPPTSPVFTMKFVYIYDFSDEYVYVGYTGGYTGSFLYQGCLFYGTGYQYKPWYKSKYYTRPMTYSFGVNRRPSKSNIRVTVGYGYGYPGMGYPGYYSPYGYYGGYGMGFGISRSATVTGNYDIKPGYERKPFDPVNIYNNRVQGILGSNQVVRNDPFEEVVPEDQQTKEGQWVPPANIYSDQSGDLYKQDLEGSWFMRQDGVWVKTKSKPRMY